jgi:hypothetical protein
VTPGPAPHQRPSLVEYPGPTWVKIPAWPATMIEPSELELVRWAELWRNPQAGRWAQARQQHAVANLVRAELRCGPRRPSTWARVEVDRLRAELGLGQRRRRA